MKILFAGGGTAGHINPAIAMANHIRDCNPDAEIAFVGTPRGMENRLVPKEGYQLYHIDIQGFQRKLSLKNIQTVYKAAKALSDSGRIIRQFKPDVVVGTGGYVSGPVLYKAAKMGVKTVIHEQNAFPGMTSKMLSKVVDKVLISFDSSRKFFKVPQEKFILTGNPIRDNMSKLSREEAKAALGVPQDRPLLVCFAGSLGAEAINRVMEQLVQAHKDDHELTVIWATGERYYEEEHERLKSIADDQQRYGDIHLQRYIYNMDQVMAAADLLVCRSGAITMSEIACLGKASILIPSPNVTGNHQYHNAKSFADIGGAVLVEEKELTPKRLEEEIQRLLADPAALAAVETNVKKVAYPQATDTICKIITDFAMETPKVRQ